MKMPGSTVLLQVVLHMLISHTYANCPDEVTRTLAPGQTCMKFDFQVFGKWVSTFDNTKVTGLRPGIDCYPEGVRSYRSTSGDRECSYSVVVKGVCSWHPNHCWPGDCADDLASNCQCRNGFSLHGSFHHERRCELLSWSSRPDLHTCRVAVVDSQGTNTNSTNSGGKTDCSSQQDVGIRTQPTQLFFVIKADFRLQLGSLAPYVSESQVGIVDADIKAVRVSLNGSETTILTQSLDSPPYCQERASDTDPVLSLHDCEATLTLPQHRVNLRDGDSVCAVMEAYAGGYYKLKDYSGNYKGTETFTRTKDSNRVCFIYDETKPAHCSEKGGPCSVQAMELSTRLTRSNTVTVRVDGWDDPRPPGGESNPKSASGIERFRLEVHGVDVGNTRLSVQHDAIVALTKVWNASQSYGRSGGPYDVTVTLPEVTQARLYALILEVHDKAGNVGYARRLVLLDNSSSVDLLPSSSLRVIHANPSSNNRWQADVSQALCVNWTGRFYNTEMYHNNWLKPINTDTGREIYNQYDQTSGILPVSGTDNVIGVTKFEVSWSRNQSPRTAFTKVSNLFAQTTCLSQLQLRDGETYDVWIKASDIMNNTKEDSVRVSIDHTGPSVSVDGLRGRWNRTGLYVHNSTDLSTMTLVLTAADPHSGLKAIHWALSTEPLGNDVGTGTVGVQRLDNTTSCHGLDNCYCPAVGVCELDRYLVTFPSLVHTHSHQGDHHRQYYVTITVINQASLSSRETVEILLDESPPTVGVVWEGLSQDGQAEMDFTSSDALHVRWHGFHDHESGVLLYRLLLAERCLTVPEMNEAENATEVGQGETATLRIPKEGRYYVSVVAYNGALAPSEVACSDGITYDSTPPALLNVSIAHARSGHMLGCTQPGRVWLLHSNLTRVALDSDVTACSALCAVSPWSHDVIHLPVSSPQVLSAQLSLHYCQTLPLLSQHSLLLLPSDDVSLSWQARDAESQMEEFYVGMATDRSASSAPDLMTFTPTHGHRAYHTRHVGLGHGDLFFIFLQALNKAGLNVTLTLGPVMIDVTPPDVTRPLAAVVQDGYLLVTWQDGVFVDREQPAGVDFQILFRVGYSGGFVTPFLEMPESTLPQCRKNNIVGCARYPLTELFKHDTQDGRSFFLQLHVINAAGHVTTVNTSSVRLPAHYPPSHAVIMDVIKTMVPRVEPTTPAQTSTFTPENTTAPTDQVSALTSESMTSSPSFTSTTTDASVEGPDGPQFVARYSADVDAILQREEVCAAWSGFHHQEETTVKVGLGTLPGQDDVISFQTANNVSVYCFNLTSVPVHTKVFSVVMATSSGGTAVFSSDGFVLIPTVDSENAIQVFNEKSCYEDRQTASRVLGRSATTVSLANISMSPVHPGEFFFLQLSPFVPNVTYQDAIVLETTLTGYQIVAMTPDITVSFPSHLSSAISLRFLHCQRTVPVLPSPQNHLSIAWEIEGPWKSFVRYVQVEVMDRTCLESSAQEESFVHEQCLLHREKVGAVKKELHIYTSGLTDDHSYVSSVSPCFDDGCLPPVPAAPFLFTDTQSLALHISQAAVVSASPGGLGVAVQATVPTAMAISAHNPRPCVYQWTVSTDRAASFLAAPWMVRNASQCSDFQVKEQVRLEGSTKGSLYACIQILFPWKSDRPVCAKLLRHLSTSEAELFHIIELDHSVFRETDFDDLLHSQQLGSKLHDLYDLDLDFATSDVMLSAVMTNSQDQNLTWFLMTERRLPVQKGCWEDKACVTSSRTSSGNVIFPRQRSKLRDAHVYYICATTSADTSSTDTLSARELCGDGVAIDDSPPTQGTVAISNAQDGFVAGTGHVVVTWSGFADLESEVSVLPDDITLNYSVALGSYPGAEDIAGFIQVGQRTSWTFLHLSVASGVTCVATVRAHDRVGHVTEVSSNQVIMDNTPPVIGHVAAGTVTAENFVPGHELSVHWEDVEDKESGIRTIEVGVTSEGGGDHVVDFQLCEGSSTTMTDNSQMVDGHSYVILLKATNRAGLSTIKSSAPFIVDSSPPSPGHVWYSGSDTSTASGYSREVGVLSVKWAGFSDPHSGLDYFRIGLGSAPNDTDIVPFVYVGRQTEYTWRRELDQGKQYYATLQACNRAGLCRVTSSNSVTFDDSPPTAGVVTVGSYGHHSKFLGHNSSVPVQWTGFSDPQTGIQYFTWCVGTLPQLCDVMPSAHTQLSRGAHRAGLALPVATPLYVSVRASNPAGLETVSVSDSFVVDPTPPEVVVRPHFLSPRDGSPVASQWDRSVLRVAWEFRDPESSVVSHTVSIRSQLTGRLVLEPLPLGADTELTVTLEGHSLLADGDSHWTSVSACNAAHLCVTATSDVITIDSTPPVTGTFLSPLGWRRQGSDVRGDVMTAVEVRWRGFSEAESEVREYQLMVGRRYNGADLSGGRVRVAHDPNSLTQRQRLQVKGELLHGDVLYLTLLAVNSLRRHSPALRMAFTCLHDNHNATSGTLLLLRHSCQAAYCTRECTCAARGQLCRQLPVTSHNFSSCQEVNASDPGSAGFAVLPSMGLAETGGLHNASSPQPPVSSSQQGNPPSVTTQRWTTSAKCLEGHWSLADPQSLLNVSRFQVSFSLANKSAGEGVVDVTSEPLWYDVGRDMTAVHCLPGNRTLLSGQRYVMHVRVWMSRDHYVSFISPPVMVDHSPPQVKRGGAVIESDVTCTDDIDFVTSQHSEITVCWRGVFRDSQSGISKYQIWMGTSQYASNHYQLTYVGLNTTWTFPVMHLEPGTRYYVTVRAWNEAGLQTTAVSDGFLIDVTPPVPGVVFASGRHSNRHAQSSTSTLAASWHGFEDRHSGVASYHVAVYDTSDLTTPVVPFADVGLKTEVTLQNLTLQHEHSYIVAVTATDAAGLQSQVAHSPAILVDVTPPEGVTCTEFNLQEETTLTPTADLSALYDTYRADVTGHVRGRGEVVRVEVRATELPPSAVGVLQVAELRMPLHFRFSPSGGANAQHHFLSPDAGDLPLSVVVEAKAGAVITATLYNCSHTLPSLGSAITLRQMSHNSISVCARIRDLESGVPTLMLGAGTTAGGLQVRPWTRQGHSGHVTLAVQVPHATPLYVTAVARNRAGQWSRFISQPLVFDRTAPGVSDVTLTLRYEGEGEVKVRAEGRWTAEDTESGVEYCTCHLEGHLTVQPALQTASHVTEGRCQWQLREAQHGSEVKVSVTCVNAVQLQTTVTSSPVVVLLRPPDVSEVVVDSLSNNALMSPYDLSSPQVRSGNSSLQFFWRGVQDPTVTQFHFRFLQESRPLTQWSSLDAYKTMTLLERGQGSRTGEVTLQLKAANNRDMNSEVKSATALLDDTTPNLTGSSATVSVRDDMLHLDWRDVFDVTRDVTYSVFAGSEEGFGDVINHVTTTSTSVTAYSSRSPSLVYVTIEAVYDNGLSRLYIAVLKPRVI